MDKQSLAVIFYHLLKSTALASHAYINCGSERKDFFHFLKKVHRFGIISSLNKLQIKLQNQTYLI